MIIKFPRKSDLDISIIIVLVVALFASYAIYSKYQDTNEILDLYQNYSTAVYSDTTPLPTPDTTNWKIYTNKEYLFEFKYPNNYQVTPTSLSQTKSAVYKGPFKVFNIKKIGDNVSSIIINPEGLIVFNPNPAAKMTGSRIIGSSEVSRYHFINNVGAEVEYYRGFNNPKLPYFTIETYAQDSAARNDIDQILSTFKFTN